MPDWVDVGARKHLMLTVVNSFGGIPSTILFSEYRQQRQKPSVSPREPSTSLFETLHLFLKHSGLLVAQLGYSDFLSFYDAARSASLLTIRCLAIESKLPQQ